MGHQGSPRGVGDVGAIRGHHGVVRGCRGCIGGWQGV